MKSAEPAFALERTELFENLDRGAVDAARAGAVRREQAVGSVLLRQGEDPTHLYVIEKGRLKMTRVTPDGAQMTVGVLGAGEVVGCVAVFKGMPYPASGTAIEDLTVLSWSRATVDRMLKEQPGFAKNALRIVGSRTTQM